MTGLSSDDALMIHPLIQASLWLSLRDLLRIPRDLRFSPQRIPDVSRHALRLSLGDSRFPLVEGREGKLGTFP